MDIRLLERERDAMLKRLRSGTPHNANFRRAIDGCFDIAKAAQNGRRDMSFNQNLSQSQKKEELKEYVDKRLFPQLAELTASAKKLKAEALAEQKQSWDKAYVSKDVAALKGDVACVEVALYFAKREMQPMSGLSSYDFDALMIPGA